MKKAACITICLVAVIAIGAIDDLTPQEELRDLRAVNKMLKAQIHALKRRLAAATSKPATRPTSGAASRPKPGTVPDVKGEAGSTAFTVILYEDNPKWWVDLAALAKEVATRHAIRQLAPKHAVNVWLDNNKGFIGKPVKWKLRVAGCESLTKSMAGERYYKAMNSKDDVEKTLAAQKRTSKGTKTTEAMRQAAATARRRIRQYEAEAAQYKALMDSEGGTLVTGGIQKPASVTVVAAIPGGKPLTPGKQTDVSGKIANTIVGTVSRYMRPSSVGGSGNLHVILVGQ